MYNPKLYINIPLPCFLVFILLIFFIFYDLLWEHGILSTYIYECTPRKQRAVYIEADLNTLKDGSESLGIWVPLTYRTVTPILAAHINMGFGTKKVLCYL